MALFFNGLKGLAISFAVMFLTGLIVAVFPGFSGGGGDIKLAAGCGAWLGVYSGISFNIAIYYVLNYIVVSMLTVWFAATFLTIKKQGLATVRDYVSCEILTLGKVKHKYEGVPMAPFMLVAYIFVEMLFIRGW